MNTKVPWEDCFVDAERGLASFDGVTIEADSINDPRHDRVYPIFEEEQVFMCRQMLPLFKRWTTHSASEPHQQPRRPLALDVGTGSGVFAIWAAKVGCKVYAVDISGRSIEFTRHNAQANHVQVFEFTNWRDFEMAREPGIWLRLARFDEELVTKLLDEGRAREEGCFDFIMLNPPYNPTFEKVIPALHANGGVDGQAEFNHQIRWVPRLLRNGGYCAGHHMGVIGRGQEHPNVISRIEEAFGEYNREISESAGRLQERPRVQYGAIGEYVKVLDSDREVTDFLAAQYSTYLTAEKYRQDVLDYITRVGSKWALFSLLYFEFKKREVLAEEQSLVAMVEITDCKARPVPSKNAPVIGWNWESRECLHRRIIG